MPVDGIAAFVARDRIGSIRRGFSRKSRDLDKDRF